MSRECRDRKIPMRRKFPTKRAAEGWVRELLERLTTEPSTRIRVHELCVAFLASKGTAVVADTMQGYKTATGRLLAFCDASGIVYTDQMQRGVIGDYLDHLRATVSKRTASQYLAVAGVWFGWGVERGYLSHNPFAGKARRSRKSTRRTLTDKERALIMAKSEHRDLWMLMLGTGLRVVEVCRLTSEDVRLDSPSPHLAVLGKGNKQRTVRLSPECARAASRLLASNGGRIWGGSRRNLHLAWKSERDSLGIAAEITLHVFRHDFASWLVNVENLQLPDVQLVLGHADLATTAIYLHPDGRRLEAALGGRGRALFGNNLVTEAEKA